MEAEGAFESFLLKESCFPRCAAAALADAQSWACRSSRLCLRQRCRRCFAMSRAAGLGLQRQGEAVPGERSLVCSDWKMN